MSYWSQLPQARRDVLESLVAEFSHNYAKGRTTLAVDGPDGAGKTRFADDLALAFRRVGFEVFRASIDDFHRPRDLRYVAGRFSAEGYYREAFDYSLFRRVLLEPFRMAGSTGFVLAAFDVARDAPIEPVWTTGEADAILLVDGVFLNRPELHGYWNFSIWLDADAEVRYARMVERDGADPDPAAESNQRYIGAQSRYVRDAHPNIVASAIVDNTDPDHPVRRFADYCSIEPSPL
ncbi:MAG: uridine kinase [Pseudolysinimonas sp.]|uniref:uridine kinase n=1 Tax=Pseudolysinimonas sp. TaxID=2680009 RepID=UPI003265C279